MTTSSQGYLTIWQLRELSREEPAGSEPCTALRRKDKGTVSKLIAGRGVYICNECVGLCNLILAEEKTPEFRAWNERPDDELLAGLGRIQAVVSQVDAAVYDYVDTLRARGISWTRIGRRSACPSRRQGSGSPGGLTGRPEIFIPDRPVVPRRRCGIPRSASTPVRDSPTAGSGHGMDPGMTFASHA